MTRHPATHQPAADRRLRGARWLRLLLAVALFLGATGSIAASGVALASDAGSGRSAPGPPSRPSVRAWRWPLAGRPAVLRRFDPPSTPYGPGHRGVDLGGAPGDLVLAAGPGVVAYAGVLAGRGVVSVQHPSGLRTTYEPLSVAVESGATVVRGTVLGRLLGGHAGCPWPACLHWGLRRGDTYLDPLALLRRGPVRLLPLRRPAATVGALEPTLAGPASRRRRPGSPTGAVPFLRLSRPDQARG
jgi:murein DD-endopeptidase MepM/ murein hydrolase activator NlpD